MEEEEEEEKEGMAKGRPRLLLHTAGWAPHTVVLLLTVAELAWGNRDAILLRLLRLVVVRGALLVWYTRRRTMRSYLKLLRGRRFSHQLQ